MPLFLSVRLELAPTLAPTLLFLSVCLETRTTTTCTKFVAAGCGNELVLYNYLLQKDAEAQLKQQQQQPKTSAGFIGGRGNSGGRGRSSNVGVAELHKGCLDRFRLALRLPLKAAQRIVTFSAVNSFLSPLVVAAGSDRSLEVINVSTQQSECLVRDAHSKAVTCIALAEGSSYVSHPPAYYDLFLTSSCDNVVKLWDMRTMGTHSGSVACFGGCSSGFAVSCGPRVHSRHPQVGVSLSPCLRYAACGSENNCWFLYDLRWTGAPLQTCRVGCDIVSTVAFNPKHPPVATAGFDGHVRFFSDK